MAGDLRTILKRLGIEVVRESADHYEALCPYHDDTNPSWRIRRRGERRGLHHCQACKEGGDLVELVKQCKGYGTRDGAKGWLEKIGEEVTVADLEAPAVRLVIQGGLARAFRMPAGVDTTPLEQWPGPVREYAEGRGLTAEQVARWGVGYALEGRLAGRIVVPVRRTGGELAGYMARAFGRSKRRYLYPYESEGADLSVMFGEAGWRGARASVVLTEGALKSLAVERVVPGAMHAALGGSGLRPMYVAKLATFQRVVVMTDEDPAGRRVGDELEAVLRGAATTARVRLPEGKDADTVEPEVLRAALAAALR